MKSKTAPIFICVLIPLLAVAVAVALIYFKKLSKNNSDLFPYAEYIATPENLAGNTYTINANILGLLHQEEGKGRLVKLSIYSEDKRDSDTIAVFIPDNIKQNLSVGQRYEMKVSVQTSGGILVREMEKF